DRQLVAIIMEATRLWEQTDRETGGKTGFKRGGISYLASTSKRMEKLEKWLDIAREHQLDTRLMTRDDLENVVDRSGANGKGHAWIGGTTTPSDAKAEAWQAIPAVAELARSAGVSIIENCAVRMLDVSNGVIKGVFTEKGRIACEQVVLAAGAWSGLFARRHGVGIPQLSVRSTVCRTVPLPSLLEGNAADESIAFRQCSDGGYNLAGGANHDLYVGPDAFRHFFKYLPVAKEHLKDTTFRFAAPKGFPDSWTLNRNWQADEQSPFENLRVLNPEPNRRQVETIRKNFATRFPQVGKPEIKTAWAGMIDSMPDIVPVVDRTREIPGMIIATGMSGHGFGIGPGFGKIVAAMAQNKPVGHDMSRFRISRFTDGSRMMPGPAI
ncbi:MAG: FAD-binding oxidoreductase, partial [Pseudomonadota bacterium]